MTLAQLGAEIRSLRADQATEFEKIRADQATEFEKISADQATQFGKLGETLGLLAEGSIRTRLKRDLGAASLEPTLLTSLPVLIKRVSLPLTAVTAVTSQLVEMLYLEDASLMSPELDTILLELLERAWLLGKRGKRLSDAGKVLVMLPDGKLELLSDWRRATTIDLTAGSDAAAAMRHTLLAVLDTAISWTEKGSAESMKVSEYLAALRAVVQAFPEGGAADTLAKCGELALMMLLTRVSGEPRDELELDSRGEYRPGPSASTAHLVEMKVSRAEVNEAAKQLRFLAEVVSFVYSAAKFTPLHIVAEVALLQNSNSRDRAHAQSLRSLHVNETIPLRTAGVTMQLVVSYGDKPWNPAAAASLAR